MRARSSTVRRPATRWHGWFFLVLALSACGGRRRDGGDDERDGGRDAAGDGDADSDADSDGDADADADTDADADADGDADPCAEPVKGDVDLELELVADGLDFPLAVVSPPDDSRIFVVEQTGAIRVIAPGEGLLDEPFLDLGDDVSGGYTQGLLGLAFHPGYAENGRFFVHYSDWAGWDDIVEYAVSDSDPDRADPDSAREVLVIRRSQFDHNGGDLRFAPDGTLYIATGDGGGQGDPLGSGQDTDSLLGKILRLDVDAGEPYAIPDDNPFAAGGGAPEIWALGLRNPWRFSFDRETGDLWIGDVGQDRYEEIDFQPAASGGGENYGWSIVEGDGHCHPAGDDCDQTGLTGPLYEYPRDEGCSVTGGFVYRGCAMPGHEGKYFFADFCDGWVRSLQDGVVDEWPALRVDEPSSFGEDAWGELYVASLQGRVYRIVPRQ